MEPAAYVLLAVKASVLLTVLGLGLNAQWKDALYLFRRPSLLLKSLVSMNVIMPLVAAGLVVAFDLATTVKIALVALAISPVPPMLPKKQVKAGGQEAYAIGLLVAVALLAIITVPVVVSWFIRAFGLTGEIAPLTVAKVVFASVLAPLAIGIVVRQSMPKLAERIAGAVATCGTVLLIACALPVLYFSWPAIQALFGDGTVLVMAAMAVIGLATGHLLGGPDRGNRRVLALSTASRHPGVALAVAVAVGEESKPEVAAVLLYLLVAIILSVPYIAWRKRQAGSARSSAISGQATSKGTE
jgi:bile acid:Na+ symporter, BASS family